MQANRPSSSRNPYLRSISECRSRIFDAILAISLLLLGFASPAHAGTKLYATGLGAAGGLSGLYSIDTVTGAATLEWLIPGIHLQQGGLAYDAQTDTLYATGVLDSDTGTSRLFIIDRFTGAVTTFPGMAPTINLSQGGLSIHPVTGTLYAVGGNGFQSTALFTIDKSTGAATLVGQQGGQCCVAPFGFNMYGLGFRSDGVLFANGITFTNVPANDGHLYTLDLGSGLATDIGSHGVTAGSQLTNSGLAFDANGTLYSLGSTSPSTSGLYTVDPTTGTATLIGDLVAPCGVAGGLAFAPDELPTTYCVAKLNSLGCMPSIGYSGVPSATATSGFTLTAASELNNKVGLVLYSEFGRDAAAFGPGGILCVKAPTRRSKGMNSGGNPAPTQDCSGVFSIDFNSFARGLLGTPPNPASYLSLQGQVVTAQFWGRDPGFAAPNNFSLSNAVQFAVGP